MPSLRRPDKGNIVSNPHNFARGSMLGKMRRVGYALRYNYPLEDIESWDPMPGDGKWSSGN
jgi:hypothetical protein